MDVAARWESMATPDDRIRAVLVVNNGARPRFPYTAKPRNRAGSTKSLFFNNCIFLIKKLAVIYTTT